MKGSIVEDLVKRYLNELENEEENELVEARKAMGKLLAEAEKAEADKAIRMYAEALAMAPGNCDLEEHIEHIEENGCGCFCDLKTDDLRLALYGELLREAADSLEALLRVNPTKIGIARQAICSSFPSNYVDVGDSVEVLMNARKAFSDPSKRPLGKLLVEDGYACLAEAGYDEAVDVAMELEASDPHLADELSHRIMICVSEGAHGICALKNRAEWPLHYSRFLEGRGTLFKSMWVLSKIAEKGLGACPHTQAVAAMKLSNMALKVSDRYSAMADELVALA